MTGAMAYGRGQVTGGMIRGLQRRRNGKGVRWQSTLSTLTHPSCS